AIEQQIKVTENGKIDFRKNLMIGINSKGIKGIEFNYKDYPRLRKAIEQKLFSEIKGTVVMTTSSVIKDEAQQRKLSEVQQRLIDEKGYCAHCSNDLI